MEIKKAVLEDIEEITTVARLTWAQTYQDIIPYEVQDQFINIAYSPERLVQRITNSSFYTAHINDTVVGFINYSKISEADENNVELVALYVLPENQGQGVGSKLLLKIYDDATAGTTIFCNVEKENIRGVSFYKSKGFSVESCFQEDLFGHTLETFRMVCK